MPIRHFQGLKPLSIPCLALAAGALFACAARAADPAERPGRTRSSTERMQPERLAALHEAVAALQSQRSPVALMTGWNDYKAILHAHAEDSTHTGGTRPEMLAEAKRAGVDIIMLTDHFRPPKDFIEESWRGLHEGVLFIPGSETHGFLIYPETSIMDKMDLEKSAIIDAVTEGNGLIFLSHVEARPDHSFDGLNGMEVYNRHADAMDDMESLLYLASSLCSPDLYATMQASIANYPVELFASQQDYQSLYIEVWDKASQQQRVTGIAANDCHHNQVFLAKKVDDETVLIGTIVDEDEDMRTFKASTFAGIREMTKGKQVGEIIAQLDLDPYHISFAQVSTHILAKDLTEPAIREALREGRAYVSHDWLCDPEGFVYGVKQETAGTEGLPAIMGGELPYTQGQHLVAEFPLPCKARILRNGTVIHEAEGRTLDFAPSGPGVYRLEAWLDIDGESYVWIYANPVHLRKIGDSNQF